MAILDSTHLKNKKIRIMLLLAGLLLGLFLGFFLVFQVLFLAKVLPHGGL
jgi:hypothetical protein